MAEALGVAGSVIGIIQLAGSISKLCYDYATSVKGAPEDISRLQARIENLERVLQGAHRLLSRRNAQQLLETRSLLIASIRACGPELAELQTRLEGDQDTTRLSRRFLSWPFQKNEVDTTIAHLERHEKAINTHLQIDQTRLQLDHSNRLQDLQDDLRVLTTEDRPRVSQKPCLMLKFEPDPDYIDRPDILNWLRGRQEEKVSRMALVGFGGFGKSQIAIKFAYETRERCPDMNIFWVNASTRSKFTESYRHIADLLELPGRDRPNTNILDLVCQWLERDDSRQWLMVLDNADDIKMFHATNSSALDPNIGLDSPSVYDSLSTDHQLLMPFLPRGRRGTILVTSRYRECAERLTGSFKNILQVYQMQPGQALALFERKIEHTKNRDGAEELVLELGYIPLAISQAAAYINRRSAFISTKRYLDKFRQSDETKESLLNQEGADLRRNEAVSNSIVTTWQLTFSLLRDENPSAADLLSLMSFFNPKDIPMFALNGYHILPPKASYCPPSQRADRGGRLKKKLRGYFMKYQRNVMEDEPQREVEPRAEEDTIAVQEAVSILEDYSLVSLAADGSMCEIHPLVQFLIRRWISSTGKANDWEQRFTYQMSRNFPTEGFAEWPKCRVLLPHVGFLLNKVPSGEIEETIWAQLVYPVAWYLIDVYQNNEAERLAEQALKIRRKHYGDEAQRTLATMYQLAFIYTYTAYSQQSLKAAEDLAIEGLQASSRVFGEKSQMALLLNQLLTDIYKHQGRWRDTQQRLEADIPFVTEIFGERGRQTLLSKTRLAECLLRLESPDKAEKVARELLELYEESDPARSGAVYILAEALFQQGMWEEATEIRQKFIESQKNLYGPTHPAVMDAIYKLALHFWGCGDFEQSEELLMHVVKESRAFDSPSALSGNSMYNLAKLRRKRGRLQEALELLEELHTLDERGCILLEDELREEAPRSLEDWRKELDGIAPAAREAEGQTGTEMDVRKPQVRETEEGIELDSISPERRWRIKAMIR